MTTSDEEYDYSSDEVDYDDEGSAGSSMEWENPNAPPSVNYNSRGSKIGEFVVNKG